MWLQEERQIEQYMNAKTMYKLTYGLFVLTAKRGEKDNGCIINTAIQAASEPNQISIAVNKSNYTHDMVKETGEFTVSVISEKASFELFKRFGFQSGRDADKFAGFDGMQRGNNGIYYITEGTNAYISVKVEKMEDLGSHTMFIGTITDMNVLTEDNSVTYGYYQDNIKPKPEAVGKTEDGQTVWRCRICGYEYVGEEIPEDFICPICKHPASDFEKMVKSSGVDQVKEESALKFYKCETCGNIVEMIKASGAPVSCCGKNMTEVIPGTSDGAAEKHVPVYSVAGNVVDVAVGTVEHPMLDVHYIEWIVVETNKGVHRINLKPNEAPKAKMLLADGEHVIAVYAYCNLHGLWKAE